MIDKVTILSNIELKHTYFKSNKCFGVKYRIADVSKKVMTNYNFSIRKSLNGFNIYTTAPQEIKGYLDYIEKCTGVKSFYIDLYSMSEDFHLFTDLPLGWNGRIDYSTNNANTFQNRIQLEPIFNKIDDPSCFARIEITFDALINKGNQAYCIDFSARKVQWDYYIINRNEIELNQPFIDSQNKIKFADRKSVETVFGDEADLFSTANQLIPMHSSPSQKLSLLDIRSGGITNKNRTKTIFEGLPNPVPSSLTIKDIGGQKVFVSSMYVYL